MKKHVLTLLKYVLIGIFLIWFIFVNLLSFGSDFATPPTVTSLFEEVPTRLLPCHTRAQGRSNYVSGVGDPNRAFFNLLPVTQMDFMRGYTGEEWYLEYRQYFLFIPIGTFRFPCVPGEIFP